jgi:hypothetical protein
LESSIPSPDFEDDAVVLNHTLDLLEKPALNILL